ncbi:SAM-dependent methyltransferase, partial [Rhizobiaceae bacterium]|nr:SAM-dependent methyltransferase [Rhizobiaceae bacterium]
ALCLTHPQHGYYTTGTPVGGRASPQRSGGDFITAPEVSQMFGEMLAVWAMEVWQALGSPDPFVLAEIGPGRGTMMRDLLRVSRAMPGFREAMQLHLVEISPTLAEQQAVTLDGSGQSATWLSDIAHLPDDMPAIVLANEVLDALPAHQWVLHEGAWRQRAVGIVDDALAYVVRPTSLDMAVSAGTAEGTIVETSPACTALVSDLAQRLVRTQGAALFLDYGALGMTEGPTFQAVRDHAHADPLVQPGEADLTFHVSFGPLLATARAADCAVPPPVTQGSFLTALGLLERAGSLGSGRSLAVQNDIAAAVERLAGEAQMGELFKAFAFGAPATLGERWPGFS